MKSSASSRIYEYIGPITLFHKNSTSPTPEEEKEIIERVRRFVEKFKGTHNFHNYTKKMKATDPKAKRYIMKMTVELFEGKNADGAPVHFLKFIIHGQSFIYHQIRKMIGIIIQIIQLDLKDDFLDNSFFNNAVNIWLAPPQGLLLNTV